MGIALDGASNVSESRAKRPEGGDYDFVMAGAESAAGVRSEERRIAGTKALRRNDVEASPRRERRRCGWARRIVAGAHLRAGSHGRSKSQRDFRPDRPQIRRSLRDRQPARSASRSCVATAETRERPKVAGSAFGELAHVRGEEIPYPKDMQAYNF
jgi:hypothetical protein